MSFPLPFLGECEFGLACLLMFFAVLIFYGVGECSRWYQAFAMFCLGFLLMLVAGRIAYRAFDLVDRPGEVWPVSQSSSPNEVND